MAGAGSVDPFTSESAWPFLLNGSKLTLCQEFLFERSRTPHVLRIFGPSGAGKSFLVRELMVQASTGDKQELGSTSTCLRAISRRRRGSTCSGCS